MQCPECKLPFKAEQNVPLILIGCGHTVCDQCIQDRFNQQLNKNKNTVECSICGILSSINDNDGNQPITNYFPKNLALLNVTNNTVKSNQQSPNTIREQVQAEIDARKSTTYQLNPLNDSELIGQSSNTPLADQTVIHCSDQPCCKIHNKKIEAYCKDDKQVVCIDCILSDEHKTAIVSSKTGKTASKNHEIISIEEAIQLEQQTLSNKFQITTDTITSLEELNTKIQRHMTAIEEQADRNIKDITQIYDQVKQLITDKQTSLIQNIRSTLTREQKSLETRLNSNINQINGLRDFTNLYITDILRDNQSINVLQKAKITHQTADEALQQQNTNEVQSVRQHTRVNSNFANQKGIFNKIFTDIRASQEIQSLSKYILQQSVDHNTSTQSTRPATASLGNSNKRRPDSSQRSGAYQTQHNQSSTTRVLYQKNLSQHHQNSSSQSVLRSNQKAPQKVLEDSSKNHQRSNSRLKQPSNIHTVQNRPQTANSSNSKGGSVVLNKLTPKISEQNQKSQDKKNGNVGGGDAGKNNNPQPVVPTLFGRGAKLDSNATNSLQNLQKLNKASTNLLLQNKPSTTGQQQTHQKVQQSQKTGNLPPHAPSANVSNPNENLDNRDGGIKSHRIAPSSQTQYITHQQSNPVLAPAATQKDLKQPTMAQTTSFQSLRVKKKSAQSQSQKELQQAVGTVNLTVQQLKSDDSLRGNDQNLYKNSIRNEDLMTELRRASQNILCRDQISQLEKISNSIFEKSAMQNQSECSLPQFIHMTTVQQ